MSVQTDILKSLFFGARTKATVTVREAPWGYIIRSDKDRPAPRLRDHLLRVFLLLTWLSIIFVWLLPFSTTVIKSLYTVFSLMSVFGAYAVIQKRTGCEIQVDTQARHLRAGDVSPEGQVNITVECGFDEIDMPEIRRMKGDKALRRLCLRITDRAEVVPVAVGEEAAILAIHDRVMRDLRPAEARAATHVVSGKARARAAAFPTLGPNEVPV